jgi:hypothetical protein
MARIVPHILDRHEVRYRRQSVDQVGGEPGGECQVVGRGTSNI